ncbi:hypothetical protein ABK670_14220 [Proteus mirabilis]|nr:hypothetical protein [Proteus mirabilis]EKV3643497.1 hypothetical protein [Proteus mirabilis]ELB2034079.1 hypothetical protein [Proteus mirabilis]ELF4176034.1 hypothetical protein [Proteus mirabilis]MDM3716785.1 hypothetical protein [Proteus mirabilis]MDM3790326.1 hypothetical protein [Proteus mirabilis]
MNQLIKQRNKYELSSESFTYKSKKYSKADKATLVLCAIVIVSFLVKVSI